MGLMKKIKDKKQKMGMEWDSNGTRMGQVHLIINTLIQNVGMEWDSNGTRMGKLIIKPINNLTKI